MLLARWISRQYLQPLEAAMCEPHDRDASEAREALGVAARCCWTGQMSDAWLDVLRLAVMGAVGLGGAWIGAKATQRKERWGHRRELYQPILLALMDLYIHSRHRLRLEEESDPANPNSRVWLTETTERAATALMELQRASAIAIVLGDDVRTALDELETQWLNATRESTRQKEAAERYAAVQKARHIVEAAATRHLRL